MLNPLTGQGDAYFKHADKAAAAEWFMHSGEGGAALNKELTSQELVEYEALTGGPAGEFNSLELTESMAGPIARYSVQGNYGLNILKGRALPIALPKRPTILSVAKMFQRNFKEPIRHQDDIPSQNSRLERNLVNEIKFALELNPGAAGWYDENLSLAKNILKELDADIVNPANNYIFSSSLAITSDGNEVTGQFDQACLLGFFRGLFYLQAFAFLFG